MKCEICGSEMIMGGSHSFEECGVYGEGCVHNYSCSNCECYALFYEVVN